MAAWYVGSTKWSAVTAWAALTAYGVGDLRRQLATPAVGSERVFRCTTAGTSGAAEPAWTTTKGGTTNDGTAVWTEVTGNSTYGWSAAHYRISNAFSWAAAGDTLYVSNNHAYAVSAAITYTSPGTAAAPCVVLCVDDAAAPPTALATTGLEKTSSNNHIVFNTGFCYVYGLEFRSVDTAASNTETISFTGATAWWWRFESCILFSKSTNTAAQIVCGQNGSGVDSQLLELHNCTLKANNTAFLLSLNCRVELRGGSITGGGTNTPTTIITSGTGNGHFARLRATGVDLSAFGSGKNLVNIAADTEYECYFQDCKLGSSVSYTTGSAIGQGGGVVEVVNCDSADTNYKYSRQTYQGTTTHETTIVRTGGATDGTTPISRKMASTAGSQFYSPLELVVGVFWLNSTSSTTVTVPVITDNVTLTDAECWLEVDELGTSGFPLCVTQTDRAASILATPANQTTDSTSTWTTTGLTTPVKQSLSVTFTPTSKGPVRARVMLAKASTTVYVDPLLLTTSGRQWQSGPGIYVNEGAGGGGVFKFAGNGGGLVG